ncbi:hypothetical protein GS636_09030 [Ruegeria sp. HKCCD4884]|uniref:hypothetical protein n=1 Tax=Ruegeria sp. HKCCD4884 TaxID=2683022 RepID=UPI00149106F1|nr:hypothetical protein [Ruegeria sp. HKCCD4884]NOD92924.1 hypothetical protein [Ruegeria sp. HKCCD4884]
MHFPKRHHRAFKSAVRRFRSEFSQFVLEQSGSEVLCGPMKGFRFTENAFWGGHSDTATKIFGLYEQQNLGILSNSNKPVLVDIGAADGFWGVGLVSTGNFEKSVCFEVSAKGREVIRETAEHNGVGDRVTVFGDALDNTAENIASVAPDPGDIFFLIDIEGVEFSLLTEDFLTQYRQSEFLIELHPQMVENGPAKLTAIEDFCGQYFQVTHVDGSVRDTSEMDKILKLGDDFKWPIISEGRGFPMQWLHLVPRR